MRNLILRSFVFLLPLLAVLSGRSQEQSKAKPGDVMIEKTMCCGKPGRWALSIACTCRASWIEIA